MGMCISISIHNKIHQLYFHPKQCPITMNRIFEKLKNKRLLKEPTSEDIIVCTSVNFVYNLHGENFITQGTINSFDHLTLQIIPLKRMKRRKFS